MAFCLGTVLAIAATATPQVITVEYGIGRLNYGVWKTLYTFDGRPESARNGSGYHDEPPTSTATDSCAAFTDGAQSGFVSTCRSSLLSRCKTMKAFSVIGIVATAAAAAADLSTRG